MEHDVIKLKLIYPKWKKLPGQTTFNLPPHGPIAFAACLPDYVDISFCDENVEELDFNEDSKAPALGTFYKQGDVVCYLQTPHGIEPIRAFEHCRIVAIDKEQGATAVKGDALCWVEKADLVEEIITDVKGTAKKVKDAIKDAVKKADDQVIEAPKSKWKFTK